MSLETTTNLTDYIAAGGDPHSRANQRVLEDLVRRGVVHCCSIMFSEVLTASTLLPSGTNKLEWLQPDELFALCERRTDHSDEIEAIEGLLDDMRDDLDAIPEQDMDARQVLEKHIEEAEERLQDLEDDDGDEQEVLEHWIVTPDFARQLQQHGETVGELFDFHVWGRCTSGQSIAMDGVIAEIAASMSILEGQHYDWSKQ